MVYLFGEPMQAARHPKQVGMIELLNYWNAHQVDVVTRRAQFDLRKARERLHVVEGLIVGAANADRIVKIFQQAEDRAVARKKIETTYKLTPIQSDVIASMTLAQVTRLDAGKYAKEKAELQVRISELEYLLANRDALIALLKKEMQQLIKQFGDERRTVIEVEGQAHAPVTEVASLHEREPLVIAYTRAGALKALPADTYKPKGKNGDAAYVTVRGDEQLRQVVPATSQDYVLCICTSGRVFQIAAHRIPQGTRPAKGEPLRKLIGLVQGEEVVALLPLESYDEDRYLVTFSKLGKVKKSPLSDYKTADVDGLQDMKLAEGDAVVTALISRGQGEYFVTSDNAQTLRFSDDGLRAQGRVGQGVAAMALGPNTKVVSACSTMPGALGHARADWRTRLMPICSGAKPRRQTCTRRRPSPSRSGPSSPARCSRTTAPRHSTGRRSSTTRRSPGSSGSWGPWATSSNSSRLPASTRSTTACSSWRGRTRTAACGVTPSYRRPGARCCTTTVRRPPALSSTMPT